MGKIKDVFAIEDAHTFAEVSKRKAEKQWKDSFENSIRANLREYIELGMAEASKLVKRGE